MNSKNSVKENVKKGSESERPEHTGWAVGGCHEMKVN